ncbi:hypothetical protein N7E02_07665 (plasmid) [Aliirhizobium terrae]|uniref:hypothetical protein n=1 Tax=Terrirhizobium terrae TaxID=2926709 RepID=UPI002576E02B|nr:hypothetical protein [Rhizobium sp. CC-CFT758]WJH38483.1 hypothetical protein N7E02_07665 [Rhizobium sp. CC-CFT758]
MVTAWRLVRQTHGQLREKDNCTDGHRDGTDYQHCADILLAGGAGVFVVGTVLHCVLNPQQQAKVPLQRA